MVKCGITTQVIMLFLKQIKWVTVSQCPEIFNYQLCAMAEHLMERAQAAGKASSSLIITRAGAIT